MAQCLYIATLHYMLSFEHIEFLWGLALLVPLVLIFIMVLRWKQKTKNIIGDEELVNRLTSEHAAKLYKIKFIATLIALAFLVLAATNFRKPVSGDKEQTAGIDIMIALDVSKSMLSSDIKPTRLERAKQLVSALIDHSSNNRVGLVLFAGQAYLQMPLTPDLAEAKLFLSNATPDAVPVQGTVISSALQLCGTSLDTKEKSHKAVVLITDGEDHDPDAVKTAKALSEQGVIVYTIGIGTAEGSPIAEPGTGSYKTDADGKTVISKLNEDELVNIASATGGNYFHLDNVLNTSTVVGKELDGIDKKLIDSGGEKEYLSFTPFFIGIALLILIGEIFVPERKRLTRKTQGNF